MYRSSNVGVLGRVVAIVARDVVPEGRDRLELVELEERQVASGLAFSRASLIVLAVSARYFALVGRGMIRIKPVGLKPLAAVGLVGREPHGDLDRPLLDLGEPGGRLGIGVELPLLRPEARWPSR